eukprot:Gb_14383 [translate_table: standard]
MNRLFALFKPVQMVKRSKLHGLSFIFLCFFLLNIITHFRRKPPADAASDSLELQTNARSAKHLDISNEPICILKFYPQQWELRSDQLTVLINGFSETRLALLKKITRTYSASPCVHSIFILWGNNSTPSETLEKQVFDSLGAPIYIIKQHTASLNNRFLPRDFIVTRSVLICDDDVEIDSKSLGFALRVWQQNEGRRIVGFFGRSHDFELETKSWIYTVHPDKYSILLTKLMIVATEFLFIYTCRNPTGVREYVDRNRNCEDIAMNFVVANRTGVGPVLVEGTPRDWGDTRNSGGGQVVDVALSNREDHRKDRGACITEFHRLWGRMPLRYSYGIVAQTVREQALCDKSGVLVPCDQEAGSTPDTPLMKFKQ